jgi:hypothetical protein
MNVHKNARLMPEARPLLVQRVNQEGGTVMHIPGESPSVFAYSRTIISSGRLAGGGKEIGAF